MSDTATVDLRPLMDSWELSLRAERKSPATIKSYLTGVEQYLAWCQRTDRPATIDKSGVNAFVAHLLDDGAQPATARSRQLALRRFTTWLAAEGELDADPLLGLKAPKLDTKVIQPLTDDQLRALIAACKGNELRDKRDEAIVRLMTETGLRAGEVTALRIDDMNLKEGSVVVRRGKAGKARVVPMRAQTVLAVDRYLRVRRTHRLAETPTLWLGDRGKGFNYYGLRAALRYRAHQAGINGFHLHLMRHTAAHRWLAAGGSESGLMAVAGWARHDMLLRYTRAQAAARAAEEARALDLDL